MFRLTPVIRNLIIINVIVFVFQSMAKQVAPLTQMLSLWNVYTPNFRPYQLFTYMFCHADFFHIFFNMLMLSFAGPILEEFWGPKRLIILYTVCGVGAGLFNIIIDMVVGQPSFITMIGASGAVYGVVTAFGIIFPDMELRLMFLPFSFRAKYLVMVLGAMAIFSAVRPDATDNTAHLAHLGGIVVSIILIQIWRRTGGS
jgi:membrane associated rhomboid family serine protease